MESGFPEPETLKKKLSIIYDNQAKFVNIYHSMWYSARIHKISECIYDT